MLATRLTTKSGRCRTLFLATAVLMVAVGPEVPTRAQVADAAAVREPESCLLLRNGNVLIGDVRPSEDGYVVTRDGATVHVPGYQVQAVGENLAAIYEHQRKAIPLEQVIPHLQLAEWCLQHGLSAEARQELEHVSRRMPTHPRLPILQRRLTVTLQPDRVGRAAPKSHPQRAANRDPQATAPIQEPRIEAPDAPTAGQATLAELPDDTMEKFRRRIQPLLLNTCTISGCHRSEARDAFVLDRRALWSDATQTLTSENLARVLEYVDFDAPLKSPLLQAATTVHSPGLDDPPISSPSASHALLQGWLKHITGHGRDNPVPPDDAADQSATEPGKELADVSISDEELDAILSGEDDPSIVERRVRRGVRPVPIGPRDPFDPQEFNERFAPQRPAQGRSRNR